MKEKPNNTVIEMTSINRLKDALIRTEVIEPDINENDKTPSWDGELRVYQTREKFSADTLTGRVPVQVKGTWVDRFQKNHATFQVETSHLKNYLRDGGVMFFLIQIKDYDDYKIYYAPLLPFDLRRIIEEAGDQASKQIKLDVFPYKYKDGIVQILKGFLLNKERQGTLLPNIHSIQELMQSRMEVERLELVVPQDGFQDPESMFESVLSTPLYVYVRPKSIEASFAIDKIHITKLVAARNMPVRVNGEILYDHIEEIKQRGSTKKAHKFGRVLFTDGENGRSTVQFPARGTLKEQICEMKLLIAFLEGTEISVGNNRWEVSDFDFPGHTLSEIKNRLAGLLRIDETLKKLRVSKDLNLGGLTNEESQLLNHLVAGIMDNKPVPLSVNGNPGAGKLKIGNISVLLCTKKNPNGAGFLLSNYFEDDGFVICDENHPPEEGCKASPYVLVRAESIDAIDNFDFSEVVQSVKMFPASDFYLGCVTFFALELLRYYDKVRRSDILNVVLEIIDYQESCDHDKSNYETYEINRLQTLKRFRALNKDENSFLMSLKSPGIPLQYQLAANILLESYQEAQIVYEQMEETERKQFDDYPICNLWKR